MKNIFIVLTLVWFGLISNAFSADLQKGLDAADVFDFATAFKEWYPLAEQGNAEAQYNLGMLYFVGAGVLRDHKEAEKLFRLSASQGNSNGQYGMGVLYEWPLGVQDNVLAHMWHNIGASQGNEKAKEHMDFLVKEMTASQIEKAEDLARQCVSNNYKGC